MMLLTFLFVGLLKKKGRESLWKGYGLTDYQKLDSERCFVDSMWPSFILQTSQHINIYFCVHSQS